MSRVTLPASDIAVVQPEQELHRSGVSRLKDRYGEPERGGVNGSR
jgi:hypothetical protein